MLTVSSNLRPAPLSFHTTADTANGRASWLDDNRLFVVGLLLSVVPIWLGPYIPLVDLPQHAAQIAALHALDAENALFTELFRTNWFTPYAFGYILPYLITLVLPIGLTLKLVVSAAVIAVPLMTGVLLDAIGGDRRWRWLAIPGSYSAAFYWGFLSYIVAAPIAMALVVATIRFDGDPRIKKACGLAALSIFVFFCHVIALGFASLIAAAYLLAKRYYSPRALIGRLLPLAAPVPLIGAWLALTYRAEAAVQNAPVVYGDLRRRFVDLLVQPSGLESVSALGLLITTSVLLLPAVSGARLTRDLARWAPLLAGLTAFAVVPAFAFNTGFLYERLGIFLVPLFLALWDRNGLASRRLDFLPFALVALWASLNTARFASFAKESRHFDNVVARMAPGERAAAFVVDRMTPLFETPVYLNFGLWYQANKLGTVDFNFADFHPQVVRYREDAPPRVNEALAWTPLNFDWNKFGGARYKYFLVKANEDVTPYLFKEHDRAVAFVAQSGWWWLYENRDLK
jgi:hypothetical protein